MRAFDVFSQPPTAANLRAYEHNMETANWAARVSRPWIQFAQFAWLKDGGEKAVIGRARLVFLQARPQLHAGSAGARQSPPTPRMIPSRPLWIFAINSPRGASGWWSCPCRTRKAFIRIA